MLEKAIEKLVTNFAKKHGCLSYKFTSPGQRSVPDRMYITPNGTVFFIEFKRQNRLPTKFQQETINLFNSYNVPTYVVNEVQEGKDIILKYINIS